MSNIAQATDDQDVPVEEFFSAFYNINGKPFYFLDLTFFQLPRHAQQFLLRNGFVRPEVEAQSLTLDRRNVYFHKLLILREAERSVLERNTYGINREIVTEMAKLTTQTSGEPHSPNHEQAQERLREVLIPEWRGHLDEGLDKIDALIWFEIVLTRGTAFEKPLETYLEAREGDVKTMVAVVTQSLQLTKEQIEKEIVAERLLAQLESNGGLFNEDSASDATDYEENLFSDSEITVGGQDLSFNSDSDIGACFKDFSRKAFLSVSLSSL